MVHGLGGSVRSWDLIAPALSRSRRLVLIDLPGHGLSTPLQGPQTITAFADALSAYIA
jgi:pimeloyl-ACP methyl ester carboxylesterase